MGTSHALCKEQAVTTRRLRKGCTSRTGKAGHSNAVWVWNRIRMQNVLSNLYKKILKFKIEKWVVDELYPEHARNIKKRCCWHCWMTSFWKFCWTTHVASHHLESGVGTDASKPRVQRAARNRQLPKMNWTMNLFRRTWCHVKGTWKRLMEIWQKLQKTIQTFSGEGLTVLFASTAFAAH